MKNLLLLLTILLFVACSSKNDIKINSQLSSINIDNNVTILKINKTTKSPVSVGLGLGTLIGSSLGLGLGYSLRPELENTDALNIEKSLILHEINLRSLSKDELKKQLLNDDKYKHILTNDEAKYTMHIVILKYEFDSSIFSSKKQIKLYTKILIYNKNSDVLFENVQVNEYNDENSSYIEKELLNNKAFLLESFKDAIISNISLFIQKLKDS